MSAQLSIVSEDIYNRGQSWIYACVLRNNSGPLRVEIRANAYEEQSHATVSAWHQGGWTFHTLLPTSEWYADAPSYTAAWLDEGDVDLFRSVRDRLLVRYAAAMWGTLDGVNIKEGVTA